MDSVWEKVASPALSLKPVPMSLTPTELLPQHWNSEQTCLSASKPVLGPFKRNVWDSGNRCLTQPQSSLVFTVRGYGVFSLEPGTGEPDEELGLLAPWWWWWGALQQKYPSQILTTTHECGTSSFHVFACLDVASSVFP